MVEGDRAPGLTCPSAVAPIAQVHCQLVPYKPPHLRSVSLLLKSQIELSKQRRPSVNQLPLASGATRLEFRWTHHGNEFMWTYVDCIFNILTPVQPWVPWYFPAEHSHCLIGYNDISMMSPSLLNGKELAWAWYCSTATIWKCSHNQHFPFRKYQLLWSTTKSVGGSGVHCFQHWNPIHK